MFSNALAQQGLLHFAGGCAWKVVDLVDLLGPSLMGDTVVDEMCVEVCDRRQQVSRPLPQNDRHTLTTTEATMAKLSAA